MADDDEEHGRSRVADLHDPGAAFYGALGALQLRCLQLAAAIRDDAPDVATHRAEQAYRLWMAASAARTRLVARSAQTGEHVPQLGPALRSACDRLDRLLGAAQDAFLSLRSQLFEYRLWLAINRAPLTSRSSE
jgi:hypothetical protein